MVATMMLFFSTTEAERIINRLKSGDQLFAQKFFYGANNNGCNISSCLKD